MQIKNNTNGKLIDISIKDWNSFSLKAKTKFTVVSDSDSNGTDQIVDNIVKKAVAPAASEEKKAVDKTASETSTASKKEAKK